jgi:hypothetical protein
VWVTDSTPVESGRSRPTVKRSDLAGWASYGYCSSHSRFFRRLRLPLICTPSGLPIAWSLSTAKTDERHVLIAALEDDPDLLAARPRQLIIADKTRVTSPLNSTIGWPNAEPGCCVRPTATGLRASASTYSNPSGS